MTALSAEAEYSIPVSVSDWLLIDATLDNHIRSAVDNPDPDAGGDDDEEDEDAWTDEDGIGDAAEKDISADLPPVALLGMSIRQAGWDQIPGWPRDAAGFAIWPAPGQSATMTLTGAQWRLILAALEHWAAVDESMSDPAGAATSRAVAAEIGRRLTGPG